MSVIGTLAVKITGDNQNLEKSLKTSTESVKRFAKVSALAITAAAGAFVVLAKRSIDSMDAMAKMSQQAGVSVESLSRLGYAADLSGSSTQELAQSLGRLTKGMVDSSQGIGEAKKAFDALGIDGGSIDTADKALMQIADRFQQMPDGAQKSALAYQLFGRSGQRLIPLLNQGSEGLSKMGREADILGKTLTTAGAQSAERFNDNLTRLAAIGQGLTNQLMTGLLPVLEDITAQMFNAYVEVDETNEAANNLTKNKLPEWVKGLGLTFGVLTDAMLTVLKTIGTMDSVFNRVGAGIDSARTRYEMFILSAKKNPITGAFSEENQAKMEALQKQLFSSQMEALDAFHDANDSFADAFSMRFTNMIRDAFDNASTEIDPNKPRIAPPRRSISDADLRKLKDQIDAVRQITAEYERERDVQLELMRLRDQMVGMTEDERAVQETINEVLKATSESLKEIAEARLEAANLGASQSVLNQFDKEAQAVQELGQMYVDLAKTQKQSSIDAQRTFSFGWNTALNQFAENASNSALVARDMFDSVTSNMSNAIANFVQTGKLSFKDLASSIIQDIIRIQIQAQVSQVFSQIIGIVGGAIGGAIGGAFGGGQVASGASPLTVNSGAGYSGFATGGYTGDGGQFEPAGIVHRGEYVLNAAATRRIGLANLEKMNQGFAMGGLVGSTGMSGKPSVEVNVINQSSTPLTARATTPQFDGEKFVQNVILQDIRRNGPIGQALRGGA